MSPITRSACVNCCLLAVALASPWPQWRGPLGSGVSPDTNAPLVWDATNNLAWKTALPGRGHSSPAVWGDRIFVTTDVEGDVIEGAAAPIHKIEGQDFKHPESMGANRRHTLQVLCVSARTGSIVWTRTVHDGRVYDDRHRKGSYAAPTPLTEGERVVSYFGAEGLFCHDKDGALLWKQSPGELSLFGMGPGASPVLVGGRVVIQCDQKEGEGSFIAAYDLATGKEAWRSARKVSSSWSTPLVHSLAKGPAILTSGAEELIAYAAADGRVLWRAAGLDNNAIPSPVRWNDLVIFSAGYPKKRVVALDVRADAGALTNRAPVWEYAKGTAYVPSPIVVGDLAYLVTDSGMMTCLDAASGRVVYDGARLPDPASVTASPVALRDRILLTAEDGRTFVIVAGREHRVERVNALGEPVFASAAIADGRLYLRGESHLYAFGRF